MQADEPGYTRKKIKDFLCTHSIYELIPESGKVVLLDVELPVRQAFHALHEQRVASASLWDAQAAQLAGIISASDFIHILRRLRSSVSSGANPASEEDMDQHTIRGQPSAPGTIAFSALFLPLFELQFLHSNYSGFHRHVLSVSCMTMSGRPPYLQQQYAICSAARA